MKLFFRIEKFSPCDQKKLFGLKFPEYKFWFNRIFKNLHSKKKKKILITWLNISVTWLKYTHLLFYYLILQKIFTLEFRRPSTSAKICAGCTLARTQTWMFGSAPLTPTRSAAATSQVTVKFQTPSHWIADHSSCELEVTVQSRLFPFAVQYYQLRITVLRTVHLCNGFRCRFRHLPFSLLIFGDMMRRCHWQCSLALDCQWQSHFYSLCTDFFWAIGVLLNKVKYKDIHHHLQDDPTSNCEFYVTLRHIWSSAGTCQCYSEVLAGALPEHPHLRSSVNIFRRIRFRIKFGIKKVNTIKFQFIFRAKQVFFFFLVTWPKFLCKRKFS